MLARDVPGGDGSLYIFARAVSGELFLNQLDYNFALVQQQASAITQLPLNIGNSNIEIFPNNAGSIGSGPTEGKFYWDPYGAFTLVAPGIEGGRSLDIGAAANADPMVLQVHGGPNTIPGRWIFWVGANDDSTNPGCSFGQCIMAGTNHSDVSFQVVPLTYAAQTGPPYLENAYNTFLLRGDGTGGLGPVGHQMVWDAAGHFSMTGGAYLSTPLSGLTDVSLNNPTTGQVLALVNGHWTNQNVQGGSGLIGAVEAPFSVLDPNNQAGMLTVWVPSPGSPPGTAALEVSAPGDAAYQAPEGWIATFAYMHMPPLGDGNGIFISGGTNASDWSFVVDNAASDNDPPNGRHFFGIHGDGSGLLGVFSGDGSVAKGLTWDANGVFGFVGGASLGGLSNLHIENPASGQVLTYDGVAWINAPAGGSGGVGTLGQLGDVSIVSQAEGQVLAWNGTQWVNTTLAGISQLVPPVYIPAPTPLTGYTLRVDGALFPDRSTVVIDRPPRTTVNQWDLQLGAGLGMGGPPSGSSLGCSNGLNIAAGTNDADRSIRVQNDPGTCTYFEIFGDGHGGITDCNGNGLVWGTTGNFSMAGSGTINLGFETLANVNVTNPQNGQTIVYNSSTQQWVNSSNIPQITTLSLTLAPGGTLTGIGLANLNDTSITHMSDGQVLTFDSLAGKWVAAYTPLGRLADVSAPSPTLGQVLTWTGSAWTPVTPLGGEAALSGLADVTLTSPTLGDFLIYDGTNWVNSKTTQFGANFGSLTVAGAFGASGQISLPHDYHGWVGPYLSAIAWDPEGNFVVQNGNVYSGGSTFTLAQDPTQPLQAATKQYVDAAIVASPKALSELTDVSLNNLQNLQVLGYDETVQRWVNAALPGGAEIDSLASLLDVSLNLPVGNGQALVYSTAVQRWQNQSITNALNQLTDVSVAGMSQGQVLAWSTTTSRWVNINSVNPVALASPQNGQVLTYNGTNWVNAAPAFSPVFNTPALGQAIVYNGTNWTNAASVYPVSLSSPAAGQVLAYNGTNWTNVTPVSVTVAATAPANPQPGWLWWDAVGGQLYVWYQSQWVVANPTGAFGLGNLTDVALASPANGQVLSYNGTRWQNQSWIGLSNASNLSWDPTYGFILDTNAAATQFGMVVRGGTFSTLTVEGQSHTGTNVLSVAGGTTAADTVAVFTDATGTHTYFRIYGDGTTALNDSRDSTIQLQMRAAAGRTALWINGAPSQRVLYINANASSDPNVFPASVVAPNTGVSNGLSIMAGINNNDRALQIYNAANNLPLMFLRGDGPVYFGNPGTAGGPANAVWASGYLQAMTSSARYKTAICSVRRDRVRQTIEKLRVITYRSKCENDDPNKTFYGLIAEEVAEADPMLVDFDKDGRPRSVHYDRIAMLLLPLMQELLGMDEPEGAY